eukprot:1173112-Alexandrium_andersonii.AAC.1
MVNASAHSMKILKARRAPDCVHSLRHEGRATVPRHLAHLERALANTFMRWSHVYTSGACCAGPEASSCTPWGSSSRR